MGHLVTSRRYEPAGLMMMGGSEALHQCWLLSRNSVLFEKAAAPQCRLLPPAFPNASIGDYRVFPADHPVIDWLDQWSTN
jgi:hypothetical protein